ncbi:MULTISPECIES: hypothetical protein [Leuconostoc]|jgi:prepilin signal peptidase PulO-like enzyme (type II secretory pathway)|uniref:Uncharacterized protein n=2 Tax=Leuconostoc citreum TaxID=33964 RepID=B1MYB7_LEUCK|nr:MULTISPECIES: hypothetical protein [Leuconostoc]ACA82519.1 Protein of unknown function [Leuconostoc citreum KM20]KAF0261420.1 hypothetical protein CRI81_04435 [Leuconostoc citreum]MBA5937527.1 hypothetical protein [Leuconostoc citreum]MBE4725178.1 hypothetical protein [Leuconostoc citreum]MBU7450352.1 hypothetical protein [Leuconostoc citreum]
MIVLHVLFGLMILVGTILTGISFQGDTQKLTKLQKFSLIFTTSAIGLTVIAVISISSSVYLGIALFVILAVYEYFSFLRQTN